MRLNLSRDDDIAHGIHNDFKLADKAVGMWSHRRIMRLARQAVHGPYDERKRYRQLVDCVKEVKSLVNPETFPIWSEACRNILEETGELHRATETGIEVSKWEEFGSTGFLTLVGSKESPARWLDDHFKTGEEIPQWSTRYASYSCARLCIGSEDAETLTRKLNAIKAATDENRADPGKSIKANTKLFESIKEQAGSGSQLDIAYSVYANYETNTRNGTFGVCASLWHGGM